jgi:hypothetical protein
MTNPIEQQQQQQGLQQANATCDDIPPGPLSEHDLIEQWNAQADQHHQWESLESSEQLAWAQSRAIARDRNLHASSLIEKQDNIDALLTAFHHAYSAYGWVTHQQFNPLLEEAARLASVVEEDWDASVFPYTSQAKAEAVLSDHHHNLVRQVATGGQIRGAVAYLISKKHLDGDLLPAIEYAIARWGVPATTPALGATSKITGLAWPQTLGDWNLMGPPNRLGAWRWYRRTVYQDGHPAKQGGYPIEQEVKMDSQLQPMWESLVEVDNLDGPPSTFPALSRSPATATAGGFGQAPQAGEEE